MKKQDKIIKIESLSRQIDFKIPDGYFDHLPYAIQEKINKKKSYWEKFNELPYVIKWAPVPLLILLLIFNIWDKQQDNSVSYENLLAEVSSEDIIDYLEYYNISTYEVIKAIDNEEAMTIENNTTEKWIEELSDEDLNNLYKYYDYDTSVQYY